ncbi:unnamed protein product [Urochloa decumbens]|uniref:BTB domain-containing protein n=1 Tax=Urochloa decumbens TaxID=240449 RepID=A0ABC9C279_9POAL
MTSVGEHATAAQTTIVDSAATVIEFSVNYEQTKHLADGNAVHSDAIAAGEHMWRIKYCPAPVSRDLCLSLQLLSKSSDINAIFEVVLIDKDGTPVVSAAKRTWRLGKFCGTILWLQPATGTGSSTDLGKNCMREGGKIMFLCTIRILNHDGSSVPAPPSDIAKHLGTLLDTADATDVSFVVDGEMFHAHRAILVARSPVFRAELLGSMAEAKMSSITLLCTISLLQRSELCFGSCTPTPCLETYDELGGSPLEMFQHLLGAADLYALDRLKLLCVQKLWNNVWVDTVATILACAEKYSCHELKNMCIGFFTVEKNFKKAVLTEGFARLVHQFPSIIPELRDSIGA